MERKRRSNHGATGRKQLTIAVDFDGTIALGSWPDVHQGKLNLPVYDWLIKRQKKGDRIILWTCRENYGGRQFPDGEYLNDAIQFCNRNRLFLSNVNRNIGEAPGEYLEGSRNYGRKVCADVYIDDHAVPFRPESRFAALWWKIYFWLMDRKLARMK